MQATIKTFPAPTAAQMEDYKWAKCGAIKAFVHSTRVTLADGTVVGPTYKVAGSIFRMAAMGLSAPFAVSEGDYIVRLGWAR